MIKPVHWVVKEKLVPPCRQNSTTKLESDTRNIIQWRIPDFSERAPTSDVGTNLLHGLSMPKTAWKWKWIGQGYPLDLPMEMFILLGSDLRSTILQHDGWPPHEKFPHSITNFRRWVIQENVSNITSVFGYFTIAFTSCWWISLATFLAGYSICLILIKVWVGSHNMIANFPDLFNEFVFLERLWWVNYMVFHLIKLLKAFVFPNILCTHK